MRPSCQNNKKVYMSFISPVFSDYIWRGLFWVKLFWIDVKNTLLLVKMTYIEQCDSVKVAVEFVLWNKYNMDDIRGDLFMVTQSRFLETIVFKLGLVVEAGLRDLFINKIWSFSIYCRRTGCEQSSQGLIVLHSLVFVICICHPWDAGTLDVFLLRNVNNS